MEQSIEYLKEQFRLQMPDIRTYSPLTLAYIGDCAYEMVIRTLLLMQGNCPVGTLHQRASRMAKAQTQARMVEAILPDLTEEETYIFRRGRNAHSMTTAKNASVIEYRKATGFEAVMGYLYLQNQWERIIDLVKLAMEKEHLKL